MLRQVMQVKTILINSTKHQRFWQENKTCWIPKFQIMEENAGTGPPNQRYKVTEW